MEKKLRFFIFTSSIVLFSGCINKHGVSMKYYSDCKEYYDLEGKYHKECGEDDIFTYKGVKKALTPSKEKKNEIVGEPLFQE